MIPYRKSAVVGGPERLRSGCKINLGLKIGALRASGLHEVNSLMLPLAEPHDEIVVQAARDMPEGSATTRFLRAPGGKPIPDIDATGNTLTRAYAWFAERTGFAPALDITVYKGVPHGSGLGGGSADAAALLLFLRGKAARAGCPAGASDEEAFVRAAAQTGSDVPFFLRNVPSRISGVGDIVEAVPDPFPSFVVLLLCPELRISTAWAFSELDRQRSAALSRPAASSAVPYTDGHEIPVVPYTDVHKSSSALYTDGHETPAALYANDFEDVVFARYPQLGELRAALDAHGAVQARMSGTGSAIFGLFRNEKSAAAAARALAGRGCNVYRQRLPRHPRDKHDAGV
jgi:4-diphosphocytidyl-2-C-methyl-D-erythritol kinase